MSTFSFARCEKCKRLNIAGARCVCSPPEPRDCDCTYDGNKQNIGPKCEQRIRDAWSLVVKRSKERA